MLEKIITTLTAEESLLVEPYLKPKQAPQGTILIEQGAVDKDVFFIVSGEIAIYRKLSLSGSVHAAQVNSIHAPVVLGEGNIFMEHERSATLVVKSEDVKYFVLHSDSLKELENEMPDVALKIIKALGQVMTSRFIELQTHIEDSFLHNSNNEAHALLNLQKYLGEVHLCDRETARKLFDIRGLSDLKRHNDESSI